jgi:hypothetical protein
VITVVYIQYFTAQIVTVYEQEGFKPRLRQTVSQNFSPLCNLLLKLKFFVHQQLKLPLHALVDFVDGICMKATIQAKFMQK